MKQPIANLIFWLVAHCVIAMVAVSFICEDGIELTGFIAGTLTYTLKQYWNQLHGVRSIFNGITIRTKPE